MFYQYRRRTEILPCNGAQYSRQYFSLILFARAYMYKFRVWDDSVPRVGSCGAMGCLPFVKEEGID